MWQGTAITRRSNTHVARNSNNQNVTAIVGKWQICTSAIMQLYIIYSDNVILYMIIRETIQYKMHIKIESM